ncbi:heptaprenyl diphosphate synthase component 1 [Saccharibacillus sp. JS10]|uniref:heptaprenyl diphosphate synthase component 1 n=1 Tax=Saccharibacillus sp. JS10 TaxID=2950552 RepID=UPI00210D72EB|nr:heptaprenyl diphosphate synthase component 1 [Saccharibacillus sp. JS10]MCQ4085803.1 heptaprenyl diphosphate synthase component 1 [Saccharibacillus sp. JS10]
MKPYCVPEKTEKYAGYDMIRKHTPTPALPDARLRLLHVFLEHSESAHLSEVYEIATALLQNGLDIHDRVAPGDDSEEEQAMRTRQLKVLAGDYYSSRFYELLAAAGEVSMIAKLSRAIADMNRAKMELYMRIENGEMIQSSEYFDQVAGIKVRLFEGFDDVLQESLLPHWRQLLFAVGRCEAVTDELIALSGQDQDVFSFRLSGSSASADAHDSAELTTLLRQFIEQLQNGISQLPASIDREELQPIVDYFQTLAETKGTVIG